MNAPFDDPFDPTDYGVDSDEFEELVDIRRHLHAHPELSSEEQETAAFVRDRLEEYGLDEVETVADTGVVGLIEGGKPGPTLAWRADIDALPIQETNDTAYKSTNAGVMHA
ncbi:MAG: hypothetical protein ABEN55_11450, partial [Bradymonadaceae bacterium]